MNQTNAVIDCDVSRLNLPCRPLYARRFSSFRAVLRGVPDDVLAVKLRVFKVGVTDGYFDFPANERPNGERLCYIVGTAFPDAGATRYEIHATDARGNSTAIGEGKILVKDFSHTDTPLTPGESVMIDTIRDADGGLHALRAVFDGENWTTIVEDAE